MDKFCAHCSSNQIQNISLDSKSLIMRKTVVWLEVATAATVLVLKSGSSSIRFNISFHDKTNNNAKDNQNKIFFGSRITVTNLQERIYT